MNTWILILTIFSADGHAVTSVPGFTSVATCTEAAKRWLAEERNSSGWRVRYGKVSALCVRA